MGNENAQSLARLQEEVQRNVYDAIIHVGDFAYDMDTVSIQFYTIEFLKGLFNPLKFNYLEF